jgi:beta-galactosidase/beta-glucuronidase
MTDEVVHPRPQLARTGWEDLSGTWRFAYDDDDQGLGSGWHENEGPFDRDIVVPFPPESKLSGIHDHGFHPVVWYRRTFPTDVSGSNRLLLHFGAVDYRAKVWINGSYVGEHEGGHTPFAFDITDQLVAEKSDQVVVVRAEDSPTDPAQPRGKQDWRVEPRGIWYHRTTGIWQPVWTEQVPAVHLTELQWTPDLAAGSLILEARLSKPAKAATLQVRVRRGDELLALTAVRISGDTVRHSVTLPAAANREDIHRLVWSPESPTLLDVSLVLKQDGQVADEVTSYVGLRSAGYADGRFMLNDRPYYLRLVLGQGYWPESHLAAPSPSALRREVELIKELGFNGVRIHQKIEDPRFLYWCDRLGLLVWGEMPCTHAYSSTAVEQITREWLDAVRRDRSHPCIVTWVPLNESWGVADIAHDPAQRHFATALYHLTKAIDPTRPVISNDGWEHTESDIWGVHDYAPTGAQLAERYGTADAISRVLRDRPPGRRRILLLEGDERGQPVVLTEFGGLSYAPERGKKWFGYSTVRSGEELLETFKDLVTALLGSSELAGFCYTQLTDTEQETNGLLTESREPKIPIEQVRAILLLPARAIPAEEVDHRRRQARARPAG